MLFIRIAIISFVLLESSNIFALYFFPESKLANSIGIFKAWETTKTEPDVHDLTKYLVNWVAGTKLIFILLLVVILFTGSDLTLRLTCAALAVAIASFFWRLFPLVKKMDKKGQIDPPNYSATLGWMIFFMILFFTAALLTSGIK